MSAGKLEETASGQWVGAFADLARTVFVPTDAQLRILHWPPSAETLLGWSVQRAVGFSLPAVLSLARASQLDLRAAIEAGKDLDDVLLPARRLGGGRCPLRGAARIVRAAAGQIEGVAWSLRPEPDCGASAKAEAQPLDIALSRWPGALDRLNFPVALVDTVCSVRMANRYARKILNLEVGRPWPPELRGPSGSNWWHGSADREPTTNRWELEIQGRRLDMSALPIAVNGETPDFVLCVGIPSAPGLSAELRKFYRAVDENLAGVVITDAEARIEYANPQACEILGCSPVELIHRDVRSLYLPAVDAGDGMDGALSQGALDVQMQRPDGEIRAVRAAISDIPGEDGSIANWVILIDDISERRALEVRERQLREQVAQSARLAAVGEIATMIAHEINQPLSNIANFGRGLLHRLARGPVDSEALSDTLEEMVRQVERADKVVRNVRTLARRPGAQASASDINRLLETNLPTFHLLARSAGVRIVLDPAPELVSLTADASQIEQVLVNLVKNAIEACESLDSDARRVVIRTRPGASGGIAVEVEDPAPMLAPEILKRIGEPFFTTKADGLGLGLSISRTLLENYGCRLSIRPLDGGGKAFHFELPPPHEPD